MAITKWIVLGLFVSVMGFFPANSVMAQGMMDSHNLMTPWGALREFGTVTDFQTGDLGRNAYLTVRVPQGGEVTFLVPESALINGDLSNGSMVSVTYNVVGDKNDHIFVATNIDGPRNLRISGNPAYYARPIIPGETMVPSNMVLPCHVC